MAVNENRITIVGRLTADPEVHQSTNGTAVCSVDVAVKRRGGKDAKTDFHKVVLWRQTAEFAGNFAKKGMTVFASGQYVNNTWQDKNGNRRDGWEIHADDFQIFGFSANNNTNNGNAGQQRQSNNQQPQSAPAPQNNANAYGSSYGGQQNGGYQQPQASQPQQASNASPMDGFDESDFGGEDFGI